MNLNFSCPWRLQRGLCMHMPSRGRLRRDYCGFRAHGQPDVCSFPIHSSIHATPLQKNFLFWRISVLCKSRHSSLMQGFSNFLVLGLLGPTVEGPKEISLKCGLYLSIFATLNTETEF